MTKHPRIEGIDYLRAIISVFVVVWHMETFNRRRALDSGLRRLASARRRCHPPSFPRPSIHPSLRPMRARARGPYPVNRRTISEIFCPPKPKLFESAVSQRVRRATLGT